MLRRSCAGSPRTLNQIRHGLWATRAQASARARSGFADRGAQGRSGLRHRRRRRPRGACSSAVCVGAIALEKVAIPAVPIITDVSTARRAEMAQLWERAGLSLRDVRMCSGRYPRKGIERRCRRCWPESSRAAAGRPARVTAEPMESASGVPADAAQQIELCYERGWSDGLPVVPPRAQQFDDIAAAAA